MYSSKISSSMTINNKTGETKLSDINVKADGFSDSGLLEKVKRDYNADKDLPKSKYASKWPEETWYEMYLKMCKSLLKWKKKKYA